MDDSFDIIVIGGGHAGAEAAWAATKLGAHTAMVTMQADAIGRMSCNPAIGGLGKGHMVREIDALGGLMGLAIDAAGIQFRMLNKSKGPAVWAPRAQADREEYAKTVQRMLAGVPNLKIIEGVVEEILTTGISKANGYENSVTGVTLSGRRLRADAVIVTTGTFLRALMHCGSDKNAGGRVGERASAGISANLLALGFELGRLKTGTPPRIRRDSIDYDAVEPQPGDDPATPFSFMNDTINRKQIDCWITYTNANTHDLIRAHLHEAPMYNGQIQTRGPRYCPSIEDKVVRFADKSRHQLFLEPEGYDSERVYCNGISTSLPAAVQAELVRSIDGLHRAEIIQPGYAVEYDWVPTHQIRASLETKRVRGLFLAGQINGTSGYEEAAAQGLLAGVNAARGVGGLEAVVLGREQAYMGVMIDDLVTKPPTEPYRMFTSRAEYRLVLRCDNADQRLTPLGREVGLVDDTRWHSFAGKLDDLKVARAMMERRRFNGSAVAELLRRPDATTQDIKRWLGEVNGFSDRVLDQVRIESRYAGYIMRQQEQIDRFRRMESMRIPDSVDYTGIGELRCEAREQLTRIKPRTLGQAARITGINPADVTVLWVYLSRMKRT